MRVASAFDEEWMSMVRADILLTLLGIASVLSHAAMWSQLAQSSTLAMRTHRPFPSTKQTVITEHGDERCRRADPERKVPSSTRSASQNQAS